MAPNKKITEPPAQKDILAMIEEYASFLMSPEEIAVLVNISYKDFSRDFKNKSSPVYLAYMRGKTKTKLEMRKSIIQMSKHGSPRAEQTVIRLLREQSISETDL